MRNSNFHPHRHGNLKSHPVRNGFQTIIYPVLSYFIGPTPVKYSVITLQSVGHRCDADPQVRNWPLNHDESPSSFGKFSGTLVLRVSGTTECSDFAAVDYNIKRLRDLVTRIFDVFHVHMYLLTYSMENSHCWEANWFSASQ